IFNWRKNPDAAPAAAFLSSESAAGAKTADGGWLGPIEEGLKAAAASSTPGVSEPQPEDAAPIEDRTAAWKVDWTYDGLLRPAPVPARNLTPEIFDLGRVCTLREIRTAAS